MTTDADIAPQASAEQTAPERPSGKPAARRGLRRLFRSRRFKDYLPKSLFGRAMLIIVLPIALMQIAVVWVFFNAHWETVTARLAEGVAGDVQVVVDLYEQAGGDLTAIEDEAASTLGIAVTLERDGRLPTTVRSSFFRVLDRTLRRALSTKLDQPFWFDTTRYPAYVEIRVATGSDVLWLIVPRDRVFATTGHIFLFWIVAATTFLTAISLIYMGDTARSRTMPAESRSLSRRGLTILDKAAPTAASMESDTSKPRRRLERLDHSHLGHELLEASFDPLA